MYEILSDFLLRPAPFSVSTTELLWTDPHIAGEMLRFHLDGENDLASRRATTIDGFVAWLDRRFPLAGLAVTDLGCGPGLYTSRYAERGGMVTGLDFSASSLTHARKAAEGAGLSIDYRQADYLRDDLPGGQDLATMIYGDFCAMAPDRRSRVLGKIKAALKPNGVFVFDVFSTGMFDELHEETLFQPRLMNGFWAAGDYIGFKMTQLYRDEAISLERYLIVTPDRTFQIHNWMQYYTPDIITAEVLAAGYSAVEIVDFATGGPWPGGATAFAVIARP
ncbi:SAM-dependent methyltransferase [Pleomorphomonas diazotrophica]|uniref:SAM-dependent methyltransferase n=1 Tax=Pleomorphomonas diazotrophica TaxID=1166257 RepID=A0A1I4TGJ4_9HYPH|nr:class I SAM-dependent methyltransferase [Pleomorphomonas diazotrophica]PKR87241.1 SAM-dependent methyltransferase [Pleomorphomonas diazotrophica]SFM75824.1 Methyltransferase domain-containing protein [Pleomorphomonas diazotrophica]